MSHTANFSTRSGAIQAPEDAAAKPVDLLITDARLVATVNNDGDELPGGWVAITDGVISGVGASSDPPPTAGRQLSADGCLVTPGLVNTHHHLYQNLTRAWPPMTDQPLFGWLESLYPTWTDNLDEEAVNVAAWIGLAELALSGCTTSTDHHYIHPSGAGDLLAAEIAAAQELGMRFHPTFGSMSVGRSKGGLPPDRAVLDEDEILARSATSVEQWHDRSPMAMVRIGLAPCSPFSVSPDLMRRTAELAENLDVRLHTHLAENAEDDSYSMEKFGMRPVDYLEDVGWMTDRTWAAHVVRPDESEVARLGSAGVGVAHCPSSNMILGSGIAPSMGLRHAGCPVGLGCDGSSSADAASMWLEARTALLQAKLRSGPSSASARHVLAMATTDGAACLGRRGEIGQLVVGMAGDVAVWDLEGPIYAGVSDPIEGWLRCGPATSRYTVVAGEVVVDNGHLVHSDLEHRLDQHRCVAERFQRR